MKEQQRCQTISDFAHLQERADGDVWRLKYQALLKENEQLRSKNSEMEDRFLHIVEKVEDEKKQLAEEIDHLVERLEKSTERVKRVEEDCNRYKSDCTTMAKLLRNQQGSFDEKPEEKPARPKPTFVEDSSRTTLYGFSNVIHV
ncbi:hypothetical protein L596_012314 [Steinernema carpocapsae]|uniref:Uncharacterized protein n=1 Tax=Steinernema carpocapsae TaxID=34508 RepID=A0A4U5NX22_STECR|nr:hypothetical protein L596_012314 [Steinernema carpocapsae]